MTGLVSRLSATLTRPFSDVQFSQSPGAVAQRVDGGNGVVEQGEIEVVERRLGFEFEVPVGLDGAAAVAGEEDGQIVVIVAVAVADAAAVDEHRAIEERRFALADRLEPGEEVGELLDVKAVDLLELPRASPGLPAVVREVVVSPRGRLDMKEVALGCSPRSRT